jgi:hypothetical protein
MKCHYTNNKLDSLEIPLEFYENGVLKMVHWIYWDSYGVLTQELALINNEQGAKITQVNLNYNQGYIWERTFDPTDLYNPLTWVEIFYEDDYDYFIRYEVVSRVQEIYESLE